MSKKKVIKTRCDSNVWLISHQLPVLDKLNCSSCLPTVDLVLSCLFYDLKTNKMELSQRCSNTIDEVLQIWFIANVPTTQKRNAVAKVTVLYNFYVEIGKNKSQRTEKQLKLETDLVNKFNKLFDGTHSDCDRLIKIQQDKNFLPDRREKRKMVMDTED